MRALIAAFEGPRHPVVMGFGLDQFRDSQRKVAVVGQRAGRGAGRASPGVRRAQRRLRQRDGTGAADALAPGVGADFISRGPGREAGATVDRMQRQQARGGQPVQQVVADRKSVPCRSQSPARMPETPPPPTAVSSARNLIATEAQASALPTACRPSACRPDARPDQSFASSPAVAPSRSHRPKPAPCRWQEDGAHQPFLAPVQHQAQAPDPAPSDQHPGAIAGDHEQRRGDIGARAAQIVCAGWSVADMKLGSSGE